MYLKQSLMIFAKPLFHHIPKIMELLKKYYFPLAIIILIAVIALIVSSTIIKRSASRYNATINRIENEKDSLRVRYLKLEFDAQRLSEELTEAKNDLITVRAEIPKIEGKYKRQIAALSEKTPEELHTEFNELYVPDTTTRKGTIYSNQALQALQTYEEKEMATELLGNANQQISQLETITDIQSSTIANQSEQISNLKEKNTLTEEYYTTQLDQKERENKRLKRRLVYYQVGSALIVVAAILI